MRVFWLSFFILVIDQITKVLVKTSMYLGQSIPVAGDWLKLTFTENPGMAFGLTFGMPLMVTVFSILATVAIIFYMWYARATPLSYRLSLAAILGGAVGNIIDRVFYGKIFGYANFFQGEVVDFIHINVYNGLAAEWIPFFGGAYISLFPIWNVADMAIVCGVVAVILQHHQVVPEYEASQAASHPGPETRSVGTSPDGHPNGAREPHRPHAGTLSPEAPVTQDGPAAGPIEASVEADDRNRDRLPRSDGEA